MSDNATQNNNDEMAALRAENKRLNREIMRLGRELRSSKTFLENATQAMIAKDALGRVLSATNATQRAHTEMLLENCPNIISLFDANGKLVLTTRALLNAANIHNFDFIRNQSYQTIFANYMSAKALTNLERAVHSMFETGNSVSIDEWIDFSQNESKRYYSIEVSASGTDGACCAANKSFIIVFVDLTDIMREKQRAEDASTAKSDFLATMSHEIRTPMNAILGMSEMLNRSNLDNEQKKYLSDIRKSSQSLLTIINDILDFSKVEAGRMELVPTNYSLHALLDNLHSMFANLFEVKKLRFRFTIDNNLPAFVYGDENRLRQIITNLISNALKYTNSGQVDVHAYLNEKNNLCVDIQDTGIGIRDEDRPRLFAPFEQLDLRRNKNIVGTGLGLAISYNLCKIMGGQLCLESVYGKGSTFHMEVPYIAAREASHNEPSNTSEFSAPKASILVVDDIEINLAVAEAMLGLFSIIPDRALSGVEAIKMADCKQYDIIFMDHMMPEINGVEATNLIRIGNGPNTKTTIIALTANAVNGMEEMFLTNQFDGFLSKPLEFASLNLCLREWLPSHLIREQE